MKRRLFLLVLAPFAIVGILAFIALGGLIVQLLWNALLPPLFDLPAVTFWQALGILVLSRILFGGLGLGGGSGSRYRRRWEAMTPEEREMVRERLRTRMRERWRSRHSASDTTGSA
jgi:hypothetical protein